MGHACGCDILSGSHYFWLCIEPHEGKQKEKENCAEKQKKNGKFYSAGTKYVEKFHCVCFIQPQRCITPSLSFCQLKILPLFTFFFILIFFLNLGALPGGSGSSSGGGGGPVILELPLDKIRRPLMRTRANDPNKVQELMDSISQIGLQVPVSIWSLMQFFQLYSEYLCMAFGVYLFLLYWVRPLFALWENEGKVRVFGFCVLWFMRIHWM